MQYLVSHWALDAKGRATWKQRGGLHWQLVQGLALQSSHRTRSRIASAASAYLPYASILGSILRVGVERGPRGFADCIRAAMKEV